MSAAYKCDKCSKYKDGSPFAVVTFMRGESLWGDPKGVCLDCASEMATSAEKKLENDQREARLQAAEVARKASSK